MTNSYRFALFATLLITVYYWLKQHQQSITSDINPQYIEEWEHPTVVEAEADQETELWPGRRKKADPQLVVKTPFGDVEGIYISPFAMDKKQDKKTTLEEKRQWPIGYLGVPFAEKPLKDLRLRSPVPWTRSWKQAFGKDTLKATRFGPQCMQILTWPWWSISEDCLYANIFTPPSERMKSFKGRKLPVMLWQFGGAYSFGSAGTGLTTDANFYIGSYINQYKDVIIVSFNHRVGEFGFLKTDEKESGNFGAQDVTAAYKWVVDNIGDYGGDKNRITVFGMSSGAYNALSLALDVKLQPAPVGVISMSPPQSLKPQLETKAYNYGRKLLQKLKCEDLACVRKLSAVKLLWSAAQVNDGWFDSILGSQLKFMPSYDDGLFAERPLELVKNPSPELKERLSKIDVIVGTARDEAALFTTISELGGYDKGATFFFMRGKWSITNYFLSKFLGISVGTDADLIAYDALKMKVNHHGRAYVNTILTMMLGDHELTKQVIQIYPPSRVLKENMYQLIQVMSDYVFVCPTRTFALTTEPMAKSMRMYHWVQTPEFIKSLFGEDGFLGFEAVPHALDLPYFWNYNVTFDEDKPLANLYADYWTAFANGDVNTPCMPTQLSGRSGDVKSVSWPWNKKQTCNSSLPVWDTFTKKDRNILVIGKPKNSQSFMKDIHVDKCKFWDGVRKMGPGGKRTDEQYPF